MSSEFPGLEAVGERALLDTLLPTVREAHRTRRSIGTWFEFGGGRVYLKGSALRGRVRVRHLLRERVLRRELPRLAEYANLAWLRARGFRAAEPLAAGAVRATGSATYQFLATREVPGARTLDAALADANPDARTLCLIELGRLVGRLHGLGFVHRDLYPRNLLVTGETYAGEIHLIDAWRGGPRPQLRGPDYDHACLLLEGAELFTPEEQRAYFDAYFGETGADRETRRRTLGLVAGERDALARRTVARALRRERRLALAEGRAPEARRAEFPRWDPRALLDS